MKNPYKGIGPFLKGDNGVTAIEYALIASLIAIAIIGAVTTLGQNLNTNYFEKISNAVEKAVGGN